MRIGFLLAEKFFVGGANSFDVLQRALVGQSVGEGEILGVIGDGHVLVAAIAGGFGHLFDRVAAVGLDGVHVHVAAQIGDTSSSAGNSCLAATSISPQFSRISGGDEVELELGVDLLLGRSRDRLLGLRARRGCTH